MWFTYFLCLLIGFFATSDYVLAWKSYTEYQYNVRGRTLASLHQVDNQYTGIVIRAQLIIRPKHERLLYAQLKDTQYAQVHAKLPDGWESEIPESQLSFHSLQLANKPFEIKMQNGTVQELIVDTSILNWEANIIKSVVSQIQIDLQGENMIKSPYNQPVEKQFNKISGEFKTMEDSVTGKCETIYDISKLPEYILRSKPELAPLPHLKGDGKFIDVIKTKNYSNCDERVFYHYDLNELKNMEPASTSMDDSFLKSSVSRVVLSGNLSHHTIQSSVTVNKIFMKLIPNIKQQGLVGSYINITLTSVKQFSGQLQEISKRKSLGNLVYRDNLYSFYNETNNKSSSEKSGAQYQQAKPSLTSSPEAPFLSYILGYEVSKNAQEKINIIQAVQKIAKQIGQELQTPSEMPKQDTLAKFIILSNLIRTMNYQELQEASRDLYKLNKEQREQTDGWKSFRDAVAQAGTEPALLIIKDWIENMKVRGYEAASLIASMSYNVRTRTDRYIRTFYTLATNNKIQQEAHLNDTAILSFAELIRRVNVHDFSNSYKQNEQAVYKEYIPYFSQQLEQAIREANSHKVQFYIRALGNIGHPLILDVFKPYLEGVKQISQLQRLLIVASLDKLALKNPSVVHDFLYNIYQNKGEASEVRVAAVYQLMRTSPPASMLQRMAEATNMDSSNNVNAAVKSAIERVAELGDLQHEEFRFHAQAAVALLNPKIYSSQYNKQYLRDYVVREMNLAYLLSKESFIPQDIIYYLKSNMGEYRGHSMNFQAMISNVEDLYKIVDEQTIKDDITKYQSAKQQTQWTSEQIARILNIKYDEREPLEGNILIGMDGFKRFYTIDSQSIEKLPEYLKYLTANLKHGQEFNMTKFYNSYEMIISFPTEMGLPFVYTLQTPTLVCLHGEVKVITNPPLVNSRQKLQTPETLNITADIRAIGSMKTQAKFGFVTHFDHQHYFVGYDRKVQLNLPIRTGIYIDVKNKQFRINVKPLDSQNEKVFHYSSWPYTAKHDILDFKPVSLMPSAKTIHVRQPQSYKQVLGMKLGMVFRVQYETERELTDFTNLYKYYLRDSFTTLMEDSFKYTNISVTYNNEQYRANSVTFQWGWNQTHYSGKRENSDPEFNEFYKKVSDVLSGARREYFIKKAAVGIHNADASIYDVSVQFEGKERHQYNAILAFATSSFDKKSRVLFYYNKNARNEKNHEVCFYAQSKIPNTNALDFVYALKFNQTSTSEMKLAYGESCQSGTIVNGKAKFETTKERRRYLQYHPLAKLCFEQMKQGNQQLYACRSMIARVNFMDLYKFDIKYENMSPEAFNWTYKLYSAARHLGYSYMDENMLEGHGQQNQINIKVNFEPDVQFVNFTIQSEKMQAEYNNIPPNPWSNPLFDIQDRLNGEVTCVIDQNQVNTFDNRSYPIDLGKTWHVQMHYRLHRAGRQPELQQQHNENRFYSKDYYDYAVLVRDSGIQKKAVKITLNDEKNYYEIDMIPAEGSSHSGSNPTGKVMINKQQIKFDDQHSYDVEENLLQVYALPNGEVKIEVNGDFYVIYDGKRVKMTTVQSDQFRGKVRGLCGTFDGEQATDFLTPKNCVLRDPLEFASTFAIINASSSDSTKKRQVRANQSYCPKIETFYANISSPQDYHQEEYKQDQLEQEEPKQEQPKRFCSKQQIQVIEEDNGETLCFTVSPLLLCSSYCKADKFIVQEVKVYCLQRNYRSELWKTLIQNGISPNFGIRQVSKIIKIKVAQSCSQ